MRRIAYNSKCYENADVILAKMKLVFSNLKKMRFITKKNYLCCMSCASYGISEQIKNSKKQYNGVVYWHKQDHENLFSRGSLDLRYFHPEDENEKCKSISGAIYEQLKLGDIESITNIIYEKFKSNNIKREECKRVSDIIKEQFKLENIKEEERIEFTKRIYKELKVDYIEEKCKLISSVVYEQLKLGNISQIVNVVGMCEEYTSKKEECEKAVNVVYKQFKESEYGKIVNIIYKELDLDNIENERCKFVGETICEQLKVNNLGVEWSGDIGQTIVVSAC